MLLGKLLGVLGMAIFHIARLAIYAAILRVVMWLVWILLHTKVEWVDHFYTRHADYVAILVIAILLEFIRRTTLERREETAVVKTQSLMTHHE